MACCKGTVLDQMRDIIRQIDDSCCRPCAPCPPPCCPPSCCNPADCNPLCFPPYAQVYLGCCPLPGPLPIRPEPVQPLQLPCPPQVENVMTAQEREDSRYDNFYNYYNAEVRGMGQSSPPASDPNKCNGQALDGKNPCCEDYRPKKRVVEADLPGCPRGFKPCKMKLTPPEGGDPCGLWTARILPCPAKPRKKVSTKYEPGPCTRVGCLHWTPKEGPCLYDEPCKASCFNHPPGIKPKKRNQEEQVNMHKDDEC